jgi:hypothetical protein
LSSYDETPKQMRWIAEYLPSELKTQVLARAEVIEAGGE